MSLVSSTAIRVLLALILIGSVGLNVGSLLTGVRLKGPTAQIRDLTALSNANDLLVRLGFDVSIVPMTELRGRFGLNARQGACAFTMTAVDPFGWSEAMLDKLAASASISYLTRLGVTSELPVAYTTFDSYSTFVIRKMHINRAEATVFALISNGRCNYDNVGFANLY